MCVGSELQGDFHESIPTFLEVKPICQFLEPELRSHKSSIKTLEFGWSRWLLQRCLSWNNNFTYIIITGRKKVTWFLKILFVFLFEFFISLAETKGNSGHLPAKYQIHSLDFIAVNSDIFAPCWWDGYATLPFCRHTESKLWNPF